MTQVKGGYTIVEYANNVNFINSVDITHILKGTKVEPATAQDDYDNGLSGAAGKNIKMLIRSANHDTNIINALKAAELARTPLYFRFINGIIFMLEDCADAWNEYVDVHVGSGIGELILDSLISSNVRLATESIGPLDLRSFKYIRAKIGVSGAGIGLNLLLDNTVACITPLETLPIPAMAAPQTNIYSHLLPLANPAALSNIISIGLRNTYENSIVIETRRFEAVQNVIVLKSIVPFIETEVNESGKFNAVRIQGFGAGDVESSLMDLKI